MRFGLISTATFPTGDVTTLRYSTYCNALAEDGHYVKVYVLTPNTLGIDHKGVIGKVHYTYLQGQRNNNRFLRYAMGVIAMFKSLFSIKRDCIDVVLIYLTRRIDFLYYKLFAKILGVKIITDQTEYFVKNYLELDFKNRQKVDSVFDGFDGIITISQELFNYHMSIAKDRNVFLLPMTIDQHRFNDVINDNNKNFITVVFGVHNRDGLDVSIKAYSLYHKLCLENNIKPRVLRLIGNMDGLSTRAVIRQLIDTSGCSDDIMIMGKQPIEKVPHYLYNSSCLLTTASTYISGGFPTKLGEYLLSGVPVVVTKAGEIAHYLTDNEDAFLCEANNISQIGQRLFYVHTHEKEATSVGERGRIIAKTKFNIWTYISDLETFLM